MEAEEIPNSNIDDNQQSPQDTEQSEDDEQFRSSPGMMDVEPKALSDDLTSLTWLQNINILTVPGPPTPPASPKPVAKNNKHRIPVLKDFEKDEYR